MVKVFNPKTNLLSIVIILYLLLNYQPTWGSEADGLLERAKQVFGPLPQVMVSARNPVTPSPFDSFLGGDPKALTELEKKGLKTFMEKGCITCHSGTYIGGQMYQKFGTFEPYWRYTKSEAVDEGRLSVTKNESDKDLFKVPVLRNVAKTGPYFHDGSVDNLERAEWIMGKVQLGKDLSKEEVGDINAFLKSLTGKIPEDALKVPLLPSTD